MHILKKIFLFFITIILLITIGIWFYFNHLKPTYSGEIKLQNIENQTDVYFDEYGIPHIYAKNKQDALTTLGYVHAQERLWQMELIRRIAPGKLSEIFGEEMLQNDQFFVKLGIDEASQKAIDKLNKNEEAYKLATAYLNGINQFIENGPTPIEFTIIGVKKQPYTLKDVYNVLGYMSFSFAMAQKTDPLLTVLNEKLGDNYLKELNIEPNPNTTLIKNSKKDIKSYKNLVLTANNIINKSPIPAFIGSNSWVVSATKTSTGNVIFANDPHIGYSQPSVWYEAHITTPNYEMYGYYIAGVPFPLLGHNRAYAYGLTMFENDDIDFYKEENHPTDSTKYKTPNGYLTYSTTSKTIKVKGAKDVIVEVKNSRHGPIINTSIESITQPEPIAMWWIFTQFDLKFIEGLYTLSNATKMEDVKKGASLIHAPGLNIMYGDAKGNIAWWATGKLFKNNPNTNRKFILDGASGYDDPIEYLDFNQNPMSENPDWNYVYSANNQPDSIAGGLYPGYYLPEDRAKRIVNLLAPKNNWNKKSMATMITDVTSSVAPNNIKELTSKINYNSLSKNQQKAINILQLWNGNNNSKNIAPTIYNKWIYLYLKNTFEDEMGEEIFTQFLHTNLFKSVIANQIQKENSVWWDNINTNNIETKQQILLQSFIETITALENQLGKNINYWNWEKVLTLEHEHPLGTVKYLRKYFNIGPFAANGANEVINNKIFDYNNTGYYKVNAGPSTRRIIDFSDIENSISILPTGQSGNPFSKHYSDQAKMYNNGEFRKMKLNKEEIIATATKLTILSKNE